MAAVREGPEVSLQRGPSLGPEDKWSDSALWTKEREPWSLSRSMTVVSGFY